MDKKKNNNNNKNNQNQNQNPNQIQKANMAKAKRKEVVIAKDVVIAKGVVIAQGVVTAKEVLFAKEICFRGSQVTDVTANMALIKPTDHTKQRVKPPQKMEKKAEDKKPKEAPVTTEVLKLLQPCLCEGCIEKINKLVWRTKGVQQMKLDKEKASVIVKGTMDAKALAESLKEKLKRPVEVVPPKKEKEGGGGKKQGGA